VHEHSGGMMSRGLRETMLPGATALWYNTIRMEPEEFGCVAVDVDGSG